MGGGMGGGMGGSNTGVGGGSLVGVFGGLVAMLGVAGGAVYWLMRRGDAETATDADSAMDALRARYARGEIDDEEFHERRARLEEGDGHFEE
jgi:putative membrane protein